MNPSPTEDVARRRAPGRAGARRGARRRRFAGAARRVALLAAFVLPLLAVDNGCVVDVRLGGGLAVGGAGAGGTAGSDAGNPCDDPTADADEDGFTILDGDCDDCDPNVNPNAVEVDTAPGSEPGDEDCDGLIDEIDPPCDEGIALDDADPWAAARAIELCKVSSGEGDWGLVSATWVLPDGAPVPGAFSDLFHLGHGIVDDFGPFVGVRRGAEMLALSSGAARRPADPLYIGHMFEKGYTSAHPEGFPKEEPSCPGVTTGQPHDGAALELVIRTPSNATGISFEFNFYTYEWPQFVCSEYNDFFVALLWPEPADSADGSISFDSQGNTVSVNSAFLSVCGCPGNPPNPCLAGDANKPFACPAGDLELLGTGFGFDTEGEDHGATSWLVTRTSVPAGAEIRLRLSVYDSQDGLFDSLVLIDNFKWIANPQGTVTEPIPR